MATDPRQVKAMQVQALQALLQRDRAKMHERLQGLHAEALIELADAADEVAKAARSTRTMAIRTHTVQMAEWSRDATAFMPPVPDTPPDWPTGC